MVTMVQVMIVLAGLLASCFVFVLLGSLCILLARLPGLAWKLPIVLLAAVVTLLMAIAGWPPHLGLDLAGGVCLLYEVPDTAGEPVDVDQVVSAVQRRVNPGGMLDVTVREYGDRQIEVLVPGDTTGARPAERVRRILASLGTLEFRILANDRDHADLIDQAKKSEAKTIYNGAGKRLAWWVPVQQGAEGDFGGDLGGIATRTVTDNQGNQMLEVLVVQDPFNVDGRYLAGVRPGIDRRGRPCIEFTFNSRGARLFGGLTGSNLPDEVTGFSRRLGIILDGTVHSAPNIQSTIFDRGEITGNFTRQDVEDLVNVLNAGALPCRLELVSEMTVGPDSTATGNVGFLAVVGTGLLLLGVFLLVVFYRLVGLAAAMAWMLEVLSVLAMLLLVRAALTFPGVISLLLVVVLAAGCNLLICVLVRAHRRRGAEPAAALRSGFRQGLVPIFAVRLLSWTAAVCLYAAGTNFVRGIGFVLATGSLAGLFTSLFCLPVLLEAAGWLLRHMGPPAARIFFPGTPAVADPPCLDPPPAAI